MTFIDAAARDAYLPHPGHVELARTLVRPIADDVLVHEDRLRSLLAGARPDDESGVNDEIHRLIGTPWDDELEPFRVTHEDSTVRVLHEVV